MNLTETETLILLEALKSVIFTSESERRVSVKVERKLKRWLDAPDCRFEILGGLGLKPVVNQKELDQ
tara:strand:+ start:41 stop:241 length:201 start_codon:yes stop_codon:yes gene_type:complete